MRAAMAVSSTASSGARQPGGSFDGASDWPGASGLGLGSVATWFDFDSDFDSD
jgi:hypothetical protein